MFKEKVNPNCVTACLNGLRGPNNKPNPQRDARGQPLTERMHFRLTHECHLKERGLLLKQTLAGVISTMKKT